MASDTPTDQISEEKTFLQNTLIQNIAFSFIPPYIGIVLLFFSNIEIILPLLMLLLIHNPNPKLLQHYSKSIHWIIGGILFTYILIFTKYQLTSNGLLPLYFSLILYEISTLQKNDNIKLFATTLLMFTLIHEILFCLFTNFSLSSVLIFIVIISLLPNINMKLDEELIAVFFGLFLGVRALGWTLSENWKWNRPTESLDPLIHNWIIFISAPILGILVFYIMRYSIELFNLKSEEREH